MRKSDFALISALYDSKKGGLYTDVYFPIIKYTIVSLFYQKEQQQYYTHENVRDFIREFFGIEIPSLVLKRSIVTISNKSSDLELDIFDNGAEFRIVKAWDFSINEDIDKKAHLFDSYIDELEKEYTKYIELEGIDSDKSFLDFISDNTDDVLGYFENESLEKIDSEYAVMAHFLKHLQTNSAELFKIANELFWGSVIAGFLRREHVGNIKGKGDSIEYFLDTPLVMGLLKLSTPENELYSNEVVDIIRASGGQPKIHPITMEEVTSIITSVENAELPLPNSPIESAWYRHELTKSKLARIRVNAEKSLEDIGVILFPVFSQQSIAKVKNDYSNKSDVKKLTANRGGVSRERGVFRDIHDVFMDDYIDERRKVKGCDDSCFFVTTNTDLVRFSRDRNKESRMRTIGSGKIILELWMHNTKQSGLENNALTEMIARCMDMNARDVRNKLGIVSRYYNSSKREDYNPDIFQEIIRCLYKRDKEIIAAIEDIKDEEDANVDVKLRIIIEKAHRESLKDSERLSDIQRQVDALQVRLVNAESEKALVFEKSKTESERNKELEGLLSESNREKEQKEFLLGLYMKKENLIADRDRLEKELNALNTHQTAYIDKHDHYKTYFVLELLLLALFLSSIGVVVFRVFKGETYGIAAFVAVLSAIIPAFTVITRKSLFIIDRSGIHDEMRNSIKKRWLDMNPDYSKKISDLEQIHDQIGEINRELNNK